MSFNKIPPLDKNVFSVFSSFEEREEERKVYWQKKTISERMEALEIMRQIIFGYDPATARLERFFEITERK